TFPIRFPVDAQTGQRLPIEAELRLSAGDFAIDAPGERVEVEIMPDSDSRTVIFTLEANNRGKTSGRSRIVIDLIYEAKIIAQISVSTMLVERVTAAVPTWNLAAAGYVSPSPGEIAPGSSSTSATVMRDAPSAQPTIQPPVGTTQLSDERERGGFLGSRQEAALDDGIADEPLPTYEEKAKKIASEDDNSPESVTPQPATPGYSGSAERSPMGVPQGMPAPGMSAAFEPMPARRAPRRASATPLRLASVFGALALAFIVVLTITQVGAPNPATSVPMTQMALIGTADAMTIGAQTAATADSLSAAKTATQQVLSSYVGSWIPISQGSEIETLTISPSADNRMSISFSSKCPPRGTVCGDTTASYMISDVPFNPTRITASNGNTVLVIVPGRSNQLVVTIQRSGTSSEQTFRRSIGIATLLAAPVRATSTP
ncbi:MAG: hypothetical protein ABI700_22735, partial [Chloroflexota bacterium]